MYREGADYDLSKGARLSNSPTTADAQAFALGYHGGLCRGLHQQCAASNIGQTGNSESMGRSSTWRLGYTRCHAERSPNPYLTNGILFRPRA
jgi:hypothetical protein